jgi:hypothetical protein
MDVCRGSTAHDASPLHGRPLGDREGLLSAAHARARGNPRAHPTNQFLPREVEAFALFGPSRRRRLMRTRGEALCQLLFSSVRADDKVPAVKFQAP